MKLSERSKARLEDIATAALEIGLSLLVGFGLSILILELFHYPAIECISVMLSSGFTDIGYLLNKATPLVATGIAFAIPMLAGLFNIGSEGQLYLGALASLIVAYATSNPVLALLAGTVAGASIGIVIGVLRVYRGVNEVVSSIMVNWILYYAMIFLLTYYLYNPVMPHQSIPVPPAAQIGSISIGGSSIGIAFILVLLAAVVAYLIVYRSSIGYAIRVSGYSIKTAMYAGIDPNKAQLLAMALGGAFAGLGGALYLQGCIHTIDITMSALYGLGFTGIGVALLGRSNPLGIVLAAIFVSGLSIGGQIMELQTGAPPEVADIIMGIVIVSLALPYAYRTIISALRTRARLKKL